MLFHSWNRPSLPPSHQERGENLKGGGGGEAPTVLLLYNSMTFTVCGEGMVPFITFQISSLLVSHARFSFKSLWYRLYISDSFWYSTKLLTALFNLFEILRRVNGQFLLSDKTRCFLVLKRF